jgi:MaoC dehydratase-like protein
MDPRAEGKVYPDVSFEVSNERVRAFRGVFGEAEGVPPTFPTVAEFAVFPQILEDPELGLDFGRVLHGGQEYVYVRPLRVGETLAVRARIASIRRKGGNGFLTVEMEFRDGVGDVVATARSTMIERGEV